MSYMAAFISLMLLLHSCKNTENRSSNNTGDNNTDTLSQMDEVQKDTVPMPPPPKGGIAPGQVRVKAEIVAPLSSPQADQPDSVKILRLHVRSILDYGPSTPPIAPGDTLDILMTNDRNDLKEGFLIQAKLQHNISSENEKSDPEWSLISIEK